MDKKQTTQKHYPGEAGFTPREAVGVGGVWLASEPIHYNENRPVIRLTVRHTGDRPIQVGSHFHFFEVNRYLQFDRSQAFGCHLNIPSTTAIRFEPGDEKHVELVPFAGKRRIIGFNGLVQGFSGVEDLPAYYPTRERALRRVQQEGFRTMEEPHSPSKATKKTIENK
ncbi:MAG: urease subunit beta [Alistipes sp.]|nr:urease subunit beta [Alistipes sp.]